MTRRATILFAATLALTGCHAKLAILSSEAKLPADGREHRVAVLTGDDLHITGVSSSSLRVEQPSSGLTEVYLRTQVNPGSAKLTVTSGRGRLTLPVVYTPDFSDSFADGTPDFLRLHTERDRLAFRRWFVALADRAADTPDAKLPPEIIDCASLLRYSYREALHAHDDKWYAQFPADAMPALPSVAQWSYPNTPLGVGLFRIRPGTFQTGDLADGTFAQFADAKSLHALNTHLLGRSLRGARPGDIIFYRLLEADSQYHSMIVTGDQGEWVVYHTGPIDGHRGEMRRVLLSDLLRHPDPRWRPEPSNPNFLGVYRWNILREH